MNKLANNNVEINNLEVSNVDFNNVEVNNLEINDDIKESPLDINKKEKFSYVFNRDYAENFETNYGYEEKTKDNLEKPKLDIDYKTNLDYVLNLKGKKLTSMEQDLLIRVIKDENFFNTLEDNNKGEIINTLFLSYINLFTNALKGNFLINNNNYSDYFTNCKILFLVSIKKYDFTKAKFSTYLVNHLRKTIQLTNKEEKSGLSYPSHVINLFGMIKSRLIRMYKENEGVSIDPEIFFKDNLKNAYNITYEEYNLPKVSFKIVEDHFFEFFSTNLVDGIKGASKDGGKIDELDIQESIYSSNFGEGLHSINSNSLENSQNRLVDRMEIESKLKQELFKENESKVSIGGIDKNIYSKLLKRGFKIFFSQDRINELLSHIDNLKEEGIEYLMDNIENSKNELNIIKRKIKIKLEKEEF